MSWLGLIPNPYSSKYMGLNILFGIISIADWNKGDPGNTKLILIWNVKNHNINFDYNVSVKVIIQKNRYFPQIKVLTTEECGLKHPFKQIKNQVQCGTTTKRLVNMRERPFLCDKGKDQLEKTFFRKRTGQNKQISPLSKRLRCL